MTGWNLLDLEYPIGILCHKLTEVKQGYYLGKDVGMVDKRIKELECGIKMLENFSKKKEE